MGPSEGPGAVKRRPTMRNRSWGRSPDLWGPKPGKHHDVGGLGIWGDQVKVSSLTLESEVARVDPGPRHLQLSALFWNPCGLLGLARANIY